jgi:aminoglycoside phosphotransferase (APT) family kinase protein
VSDAVPASDVAAIRSGEEIDAAAVGAWLAGKVPAAEGVPSVWQFPGGHANLTYLIRYPEAEYVLRRPPHGDLPKGAHDMGREYRALAVLYQGFPPAPRAFCHCDDPSVIGAPFFVMERRHGVVVRRDVPPQFGGGKDPAQTRKLSEVVIDTLADFHRVDYRAIGLEGLGRNPERFLERQVVGWTDRWQRARPTPLPLADEVVAWLGSHRPPSPAPTLVHNDWRLDNMAVAADDPGRCVAVYDWDMCTVGDPLTDLGTLLSSWNEAGEPNEFLSPMPSHLPGFMTRAEAIARYGERSGIDVGAMPYYYVFGLFKMAGVVQQLWFRWAQGQTGDTRMATGEATANGLIALAHRHLLAHG